MLKVWSRRSCYSPIGMDIGRRGVRLVQLARSPGNTADAGAVRWRLFKAFCWEWPSGRELEGEGGAGGLSEDGPLAALRHGHRHLDLGGRLRRLLRQNEFCGREAVIGLSGPEVELHALELPVQPKGTAEQQLRQAAHWEIERLTSFAQGEVESDFWVLPSSAAAKGRGREASAPGQPTAIGTAAEKTVVGRVWEMAEAAAVRCRRLDANVCALARFGSWLRSLPVAEGSGTATRSRRQAEESRPQPAGQIWGLLDVGHSQVRLVVCLGDVPVLVRSFHTGGGRWIERIGESLELSPSAAEIHLRDHGIQPRTRGGPEPEGRGVRRDDAPGQGVPSSHLGSIIRNILREELDALCGEVERSYRYALQCYPGQRIDDLMLVGAGAELRNLDKYLREHLGIDVYPASRRLEETVMAAHIGAGTPFMRSGGGGRYAIGSLACAIGLAIPPEEVPNA